ncbi:MAG: hypothetical protein H0U74_11275 [Bradymonadaceae bacterium]|nr:hypothetical protein [Lujinxingiaceae bacterium]
MKNDNDEMRAQRLRTALDLSESGIQMRLCQLKRRHPGESEAELQERLLAWLLARPADSPGRRIDPTTILTP